ncbi:MAG: hypothetical protein ACTTJC_01080 [Campylobacter sp.]
MTQWLSELKVAVVNQDMEAINKLSSEFSAEFQNKGDLLEVASLYEQMIENLNREKDNLNIEMKKLRDIRKYINS